MLYIRDDDLKLAFTTMINKLVYCHKLVLKPYLKALHENTGDASLLNIQQSEMLLEYSEELFELFVNHIEVYSRQKIGFALHCGLILKEMI